MIHHVDIPVRDLARSRAFYDMDLAPLQMQLVIHNHHSEGHEVLGYGVLPDPVFWISSGKPPVKTFHVAFAAATRQAVCRT
jgi:catechol 2,3-dioxygenase-like lactoylglutathione lyase family enzyme